MCSPYWYKGFIFYNPQSKKKGLSLEEKRIRMMEIFFETVSRHDFTFSFEYEFIKVLNVWLYPCLTGSQWFSNGSQTLEDDIN